jgi:Family of unknown function (DUF6092)
VTLENGETLRLRPIRPDDEPRLTTRYDRLSRQTAYQRFFAVRRRLPAWLHAFAHVDYRRRLGLVAERDTVAGLEIAAAAAWTAPPACAILRVATRKRSDDMDSPLVLTEDEALELLAFLVTAARTQLDEAAEYGPLRLLTAAGRLADFMAGRASPATRQFLAGPLRALPDAALRSVDPGKYATELDAVCQAVGEHLVSHFGGGAR